MTKITSTETVLPKDRLKANKRANGFIFVIAMWLSSRLVIVIAMQLIAPLIHGEPVNYPNPLPLGFIPNFVPQIGWELFSHWDATWYRKIAILGYDYAKDAEYHSIAFFPVFPLVTRAVMTLGFPFEVAGTLVNNLAFLSAMGVLYFWVEERHGIRTARWATAVLAWCPFSLFGTVAYTEGLFLLFSTASLQAFDKRQHGWAALWGAMTTATRLNGAALIPAFLFVAWRERRPAVAYAAGLSAGGGLLLFSVYCAIRFGDPLAFIHAQRGWLPQLNFLSISPWLDTFADALTLNKKSLTKVVMVFGGGYLLWRLRAKLNHVAVAYGFFALALILASSSTQSVHRFAYADVSLSLAFGVLLERHPRWGYAIMGFFAILLAVFAIRFAGWRWVA